MASAVWKGTLSFGLLAIPVKLYTAARSQRMNLHQLHKVCHTRLKRYILITVFKYLETIFWINNIQFVSRISSLLFELAAAFFKRIGNIL